MVILELCIRGHCGRVCPGRVGGWGGACLGLGLRSWGAKLPAGCLAVRGPTGWGYYTRTPAFFTHKHTNTKHFIHCLTPWVQLAAPCTCTHTL